MIFLFLTSWLSCSDQSPVKNGTPSLSSFSSSASSGSSSSSSSLVSMATVVSGCTAISGGSSLLGSFSSAVQQHAPQSQQQAQVKLSSTSVPSNNAPSPPSHPMLPVSTTSSLPSSSTPGPVTSNSQSQVSSVPGVEGSRLGLGLGKGGVTVTSSSSGAQMPGLGLAGMSGTLNTMAGLLSGSTPAPYAQAAAGGTAGIVSSGLVGSGSVSSGISVPGAGGVNTGATSNGTGTGVGLGLLGSSSGSQCPNRRNSKPGTGADGSPGVCTDTCKPCRHSIWRRNWREWIGGKWKQFCGECRSGDECSACKTT